MLSPALALHREGVLLRASDTVHRGHPFGRLTQRDRPLVGQPWIGEAPADRAVGHGLEARAAEPVDGLSRYLDGKSRQQPRHPGDVSIVFPAWLAQPRMTSSTRPGGKPPRSQSARMAAAARSSGRMSASTPPARPIGVRTAAVMKASVTGIDSAERKRKA